MSSYMRLTEEQTLTGNLTFHDDTYMFSGAKPSQIGYLSGVTSSIQTQLNGCLKTGSNTLTSNLTFSNSGSNTYNINLPNTTVTGVITFPISLPLATDVTGAGLVLWSGGGNNYMGLE